MSKCCQMLAHKRFPKGFYPFVAIPDGRLSSPSGECVVFVSQPSASSARPGTVSPAILQSKCSPTPTPFTIPSMINSFSTMARGLPSSCGIIYPSSEGFGYLFLSRSTGFPYLVKKGKILFLCSWAFFISQAGFGPFCLATESAC